MSLHTATRSRYTKKSRTFLDGIERDYSFFFHIVKNIWGDNQPNIELEPRLTESCSPLQTQSMTKSFLCQGLDSKTWKNNGMFCGLTENWKNSRNVKASLLLQLYVYDDTDVITENKPLSLGYNSVILEARKWFKSSRMDNLDKRIYRKSEAVRNGNFKRKAGICERIIRDNLCPKIDNKSH